MVKYLSLLNFVTENQPVIGWLRGQLYPQHTRLNSMCLRKARYSLVEGYVFVDRAVPFVTLSIFKAARLVLQLVFSKVILG
jgi:uncharacterized membrane protein